jgi:hypothetical protein
MLGRGGLLLAIMLSGLWPGGEAVAQDCVWGQPGYRACVDEKIARQKQRAAEGKPPERHKTAPAANRAPALTPAQSVVGTPAAVPPQSRKTRKVGRDPQWQFDLDQYRIQRDARDRGANRRLEQLDLNRSINAGARANTQRQQQFDMDILRQQRDAVPRPIQPY